jgi:hypothetical protein
MWSSSARFGSGRWDSLLSGVTGASSGFKHLACSHPSPLIPLPVEGRGKARRSVLIAVRDQCCRQSSFSEP